MDKQKGTYNYYDDEDAGCSNQAIMSSEEDKLTTILIEVTLAQ